MDLRQIRWSVALVVGILLCGVLWFGGNALRTLTVTRPLLAAMASPESVGDVDLINGTDGLTVIMTVTPGADLQTAYEAAMAQASITAQNSVAQVIVKDSNDPALAKLYREQLAFVLHEAIATGRYAELPAKVQAAAGGAQATVTIDEKYLYLTLKQDEKILYKVVKRTVDQKSGGASW